MSTFRLEDSIMSLFFFLRHSWVQFPNRAVQMHQTNSPWLKRMSVLLASELQKAVAIRGHYFWVAPAPGEFQGGCFGMVWFLRTI